MNPEDITGVPIDEQETVRVERELARERERRAQVERDIMNPDNVIGVPIDEHDTVRVECNCGRDGGRHTVAVYRRPPGWKRWSDHRRSTSRTLVGDSTAVTAGTLRVSRDRDQIQCGTCGLTVPARTEHLDPIFARLFDSGIYTITLAGLSARLGRSNHRL
jgi:hypothetical protein